MHRGEIAKIDRSSKRNDDTIHDIVLEALVILPSFIKILPSGHEDELFDRANPESFLTTYLIKEKGLSWYEVEAWLDQISSRDKYRFQFENGSIMHIDGRRRYYQSSSEDQYGHCFIKEHLKHITN